MQVQTIQRYIHTSPRKLRLVADMVRLMEPEKALETLKFTNKYAAKPLRDALVSVLSSAKQKGMEKVEFVSVEINEGPKMRRFRAGARGRVKPFKRRMSHIKIVLTDDLSNKIQVTRNKKIQTSEKKIGVDDSAEKSKSKEGGETKVAK